METYLMKSEPLNPVQIFQEGGLDPLIEMIEKETRAIAFDISTQKGRKEVASVANKIARSKTLLDGIGKELVSQWKSQSKVVDAERKRMRDTLDGLKSEIRKPLTDWESEESQRIFEHEKALEEIVLFGVFEESPIGSERILSRIKEFESRSPRNWEEFIDRARESVKKVGDFLMDQLKLAKEREAEQAELERLRKEKEEREREERDQKIRDEAAAKAKAEAEMKAEKEKKILEQQKAEAEKRAEKAENGIIAVNEAGQRAPLTNASFVDTANLCDRVCELEKALESVCEKVKPGVCFVDLSDAISLLVEIYAIAHQALEGRS